MGRMVPDRRRLPPTKQQQPIMERRQVGDPHDHVAANPQNPADIVEYPKYFLYMLQYLIRYDNIYAFICKREGSDSRFNATTVFSTLSFSTFGG